MFGRNIAIQLADLSQQCRASHQPPSAKEIRYILKETERWFMELPGPVPFEQWLNPSGVQGDETWMILWEASIIASNLYFLQTMRLTSENAFRPAASRFLCLLQEAQRRSESGGVRVFKADA